jgi:hypothetical protein
MRPLRPIDLENQTTKVIKQDIQRLNQVIKKIRLLISRKILSLSKYNLPQIKRDTHSESDDHGNTFFGVRASCRKGCHTLIFTMLALIPSLLSLQVVGKSNCPECLEENKEASGLRKEIERKKVI